MLEAHMSFVAFIMLPCLSEFWVCAWTGFLQCCECVSLMLRALGIYIGCVGFSCCKRLYTFPMFYLNQMRIVTFYFILCKDVLEMLEYFSQLLEMTFFFCNLHIISLLSSELCCNDRTLQIHHFFSRADSPFSWIGRPR
jgi:hypothetical protein